MVGWRYIAGAAALAGIAGACSSATAPQLPAGGATVEPPVVAKPSASAADPPPGTTVMAKGRPTEIYELVARGVLGCWLGGTGPLKASHVFHAEAAPPAAGGAAEIVLHERDASFRDQRGARAFQVAFASAPAGAQVGIANIKMASAVGEAMTKDVESWAGGGTGCHLRVVLPPPPPPAPPPDTGKAKAKGKEKGKTSAKPAR